MVTKRRRMKHVGPMGSEYKVPVRKLVREETISYPGIDRRIILGYRVN
jgi:hypothetical protein